VACALASRWRRSSGYVLGTSLLQIGYQRGAALTIAGIATLLTNALPIAAGPVLLDETLPHGGLRVLRIIRLRYGLGGAALLARPQPAGPRSAGPVAASAGSARRVAATSSNGAHRPRTSPT